MPTCPECGTELPAFGAPCPVCGLLEVRVARNLAREALSGEDFRVSRSVVAEVERTGEPIVVADASRDPRFEAQASIVDLRLRSVLCFPLRTPTRGLLGVVYADSSSPARFFRPRDLEIVLPFAAQAAQAIENAFAYARIRELYAETLSLARAREKVLAHLSHELRTPIAIVRGTLDVIACDLPPALGERGGRGGRPAPRGLPLVSVIRVAAGRSLPRARRFRRAPPPGLRCFLRGGFRAEIRARGASSAAPPG